MSDPFAPIGGPSSTPKKSAAEWAIVAPVPPGMQPPEVHPKLGRPVARWLYADAAGAVLGFACRFDEADGGKCFRPLTLWRAANGSKLAWRWEAWPAPRPLYGLDQFAARPQAAVLVTEGEKAADAAARLLADYVVTTSPNGSKSAAKADWSPVRGRRVVVWPDADDAGAAYAEEVVRLVREAGALSVAVCGPPQGVPAGWDAADAEADGWSPERAAALVGEAKTLSRFQPRAVGGGGGSKKAKDEDAPERVRRPAQRDALMSLTADLLLWHDEAGEGYATFDVRKHRESHAIKSKAFRRWLSVRAYEADGHAPGGQAIDDCLRVLEAKAYSEGPMRRPVLRVGDHGGRSFVDLANEHWQAVEIDATGWRVVADPGAAFVRTGQMRPLPEPEAGYEIAELRRFLNVETDADFVLLVMWIVAALRAVGPYPILVFSGEQGTGKSTITRLVRSLVDPNMAPIRAAPKDDRDLIVAAVNSHVIALDNLSAVPSWLADALCRLATGGGFASRALHTDAEEAVLEATRPILLNGIPALTERPDLASRAVTVRLVRIDDTERRTEAEFWSDWEAVRPRVFGALLDGISAGLRRLPEVSLDRSPRMADFARFSVACEVGLGFEPGTFLAAYEANLANTSETTFEADPVAVAIRDLVLADYPAGWHGTPSELLAALNLRVGETIRRAKLWPATAAALGNRVERVAPLLRSQGFNIERRHSGVRTISIVPKSREPKT